MRYTIVLSVVLLVLSHPVGAGGAPVARPEAQGEGCGVTLGSEAGRVIEVPSDFSRDGWTYWQNCDGIFENGGCWNFSLYGQGSYYCAFAEGYRGPAQVHAVRVYVTQQGGWNGETQDLYVWGTGMEGPGCVLAMEVDVPLYNVPYWPEVGANEHKIEATVGPRFYVGHVINMGYDYCWFHTWDEDGPGGDPWTYAPPGLQSLPPGWYHANVVFPTLTSMGIGVYVSGASNVEELPDAGLHDERTSWGRIKALFSE